MAKRSKKKKIETGDPVKRSRKRRIEISDPANVFKMAMLDVRRVALSNKRAFLQVHYTTQMQALQQRLTNETLELDNEIATVKRSFAEQVAYMEKKHGITLKDYTYNDETGTLTKRGIKKVKGQNNG